MSDDRTDDHSCTLDCAYCHAHVGDEADGGYVESTDKPRDPEVNVVMVWACRACISAMELPWLAIVGGTPKGGLRDPALAVPGWVPPDTVADGEWTRR